MKVCVVQPWYSFESEDLDTCYQGMVELIDQCDASMDLIVIPEYADIPAAQKSAAGFHAAIEKYNASILEKAKETAKRCHALVFCNCAYENKNTTHCIDRNGEVVGRYFKAHPAPSEVRTEAEGGNGMDCSYSYEFRKPDVVEIEGIRFGFMTCYDFYFYENFAPLALENVDVIIGCSHQRTDTHQALDIINRFLCYHTNAYLIRASVSLGEDSPICGCSCVIKPDGTPLVDMKSKIGLGVAEIDPHEKYYKAAGFRGKQKAHYEYIEEGRRPWLYRNGGPGVVAFDRYMPYPRLCAHRGYSAALPENTMPAYGAAIALGAKEIEFDLWRTTDGVIVSCHDSKLDRVSTGTGRVDEKTYAELLEYDFGIKNNEKLAGLPIATFEDILQKFGGRAIMNIHIKSKPGSEVPDEYIHQIVGLLDQYDCRKHAYFVCGNDNLLRATKRLYPDMRCCVGAGEDAWGIVDRAIEMGCEKVQLFKPYFNQEMIDKAHANGILCNVFWSDDPEEAKQFLKMGVDCILTNDYLNVSNALELK